VYKEGQVVWQKAEGGNPVTIVRYLREGFHLTKCGKDKELRICAQDELTDKKPENAGTCKYLPGFAESPIRAIERLVGLRNDEGEMRGSP
jgi:hypothetical protein